MIGLETRHDDPVLLSTAGWRKPVNELYPSDEIIRLAAARGIPFTLASDVHSHAQLGKDYDGLAQKMASRGVREVAVYHRHRRTLKEL